MNQPIEISLNKKKILPYLLGALIFVIAGIWMISLAFQAKNQILIQAIFILVGLSSITFFGLVAIVLITKIIKSEAGMIINDDALIDNTSGVSAGFIAWNDIRKINYTYTGNHVFMVVILRKPENYIERETNFLKRFAMRMNHKMSGSPIHILVSFLDIDLYTLNETIANRRYQKKSNKHLN
jgi:hypothetical protein